MGHYNLRRASPYSGVMGDVIRYGFQLKQSLLKDAVLFFYCNSWKGSTTRSYGTGQRKWAAFAFKHHRIPFLPCPTAPLAEHDLALAYFAAHLALTPTITRGTTVASYLTHVRALWRHAGCPEKCLESEFVARVMKGIHRALPASPDPLQAFLLLDCRPPRDFTNPDSPNGFKLKFATLLGFFGMLRFDILLNLTPSQIVLVAPGGREVLLARVPFINAGLIPHDFIGFYIRFRGKSTPIGDPPQMAYFPKISDFDSQFKQFCPLTSLGEMHERGFFLRPHQKVLRNSLTPRKLCAYIAHLAGRGLRRVQLALIKTHSLRIGGHTYFTAMGMNRDLTNYLGRRKIKDSSLRYFRASARLTLSAYRNFFHSVPPPTSFP